VNYAEEGMQGTDAGFIKFGSRVDLFYLSELQSTCLIKSSMENHYCYKSIMIEKELDTRFQEAVTILSDDPSFAQDVQLRLYACYKQATFCTLEPRQTLTYHLRMLLKRMLDANQSSH
jgi:hypothetical protein